MFGYFGPVGVRIDGSREITRVDIGFYIGLVDGPVEVLLRPMSSFFITADGKRSC